MHDPWTERLSEYLDGDLAEVERAALERHLAGCETCRAVLSELRDVCAIAAGAVPAPPERDLWPAIAARIGAAAPAGVIPFHERRPRARFSFTAPQLAAAALVLMALSGGAVWLATAGSAGPGASTAAVQPPPASAPPVVLAATDMHAYETAIAELEQALDGSRARLDPATVSVVQRSLASIDRAIEDARLALERDPANPYLHRHLDGAMRKKLDILRRAVTVRRAGT